MASLKDETAKAKQAAPEKSGTASAPGISAEERAAIFGDSRQSDWNETGLRYFFKPEHYIAETVGKVQRCWREGPGGKKFYTSPLITGTPYAVIKKDHPEYGPYSMVLIALTKPTIFMVGEEGARVEEYVPAGQTVCITVTAGIERLQQIAEMPDVSLEVECRVLQLEPIPNSKNTKWVWSTRESGKPTPKANVKQLSADDASFNPADLS